MPHLSCFTPVGLLEMSSDPSLAQQLYEQKVTSLGGANTAFRIEPGSRVDARCYAEAITEAAALRALRLAGNQGIAGKLHHEMIPLREEEYVRPPPSDATWIERRHAIEAAERLPSGGARTAAENTLRTLLGDGFIYYRTIEPEERVLWPASMGLSPMNLRGPDIPRQVVTIRDTISVDLGQAQWVVYDAVYPIPEDGPALFVGGEVLVVEPENPARAERVTVLAVDEDEGGNPMIEAIFEEAHEVGCYATTQPFPLWTSNQRTILVVVTTAVTQDAVLMAQTHQVMRSLARAVDTWAIVEASGPNTAGPFLIDQSPLGVTPLGLVTFPKYPP
jgi:hypothetical protein